MMTIPVAGAICSCIRALASLHEQGFACNSLDSEATRNPAFHNTLQGLSSLSQGHLQRLRQCAGLRARAGSSARLPWQRIHPAQPRGRPQGRPAGCQNRQLWLRAASGAAAGCAATTSVLTCLCVAWAMIRMCCPHPIRFTRDSKAPLPCPLECASQGEDCSLNIAISVLGNAQTAARRSGRRSSQMTAYASDSRFAQSIE